MRKLALLLMLLAFTAGYTTGVANSAFTSSAVTDLTGLPADQSSAGRVLLYYGNGGVSPTDEAGPATDFFVLQDYYESLGFTVEYTDQWPLGLHSPSSYALIILLGPGHDGSDNTVPIGAFTLGQKAQLGNFLSAGGHLVVLSDDSSFTGQAVENDLLADLGVDLFFNSNSWANGLGDEVTADCLTGGVGVLNTDQWTDVATPFGTADPGILVRQNVSADAGTNFPNGPMLASDVPPGGAGRVTVVGDLNFLDDASHLGNFNWPADNGHVAFNFLNCFTTVEPPPPPPPSPCPDLNDNGVVDVGDLQLLAGYWKQGGAGVPFDCDGNDVVNIFDIVCLIQRLGDTCP